jgi:hypothetical protein
MNNIQLQIDKAVYNKLMLVKDRVEQELGFSHNITQWLYRLIGPCSPEGTKVLEEQLYNLIEEDMQKHTK